MSLVNSQSQTNNPALELYDLLIQNPSIFGRLVQVASLRNPPTKVHHQGLPDRFRTARLDQAISRWHQAFFMEWLALSLSQQQHDVDIYWTALGRTAEHLKRIREEGEAAIPPLVEWAERQYFLQNLAFIHTVFSHQVKSTAA
jgi:hypothetical protein